MTRSEGRRPWRGLRACVVFMVSCHDSFRTNSFPPLAGVEAARGPEVNDLPQSDQPHWVMACACPSSPILESLSAPQLMAACRAPLRTTCGGRAATASSRGAGAAKIAAESKAIAAVAFRSMISEREMSPREWIHRKAATPSSRRIDHFSSRRSSQSAYLPRPRSEARG